MKKPLGEFHQESKQISIRVTVGQLKFVDDLIEAGAFDSRSEVIRSMLAYEMMRK